MVGQAPQTPLRVALPLSIGLTDVLRLRPLAQRAPAFPLNGGVPATGRQGNIPATPAVDIASSAASGTQSTTGAPGSAPLLGGSSQVGSDSISDLGGLRGQLLPGALQRPDIVEAQATLEAQRAQIGVLRSERRPDIEIQARRGSVFGGSSSTALRAVIVIHFLISAPIAANGVRSKPKCADRKRRSRCYVHRPPCRLSRL
jgi:hypothetical protein